MFVYIINMIYLKKLELGFITRLKIKAKMFMSRRKI